ncbi:MAG: PorT family protein [Bacteroidales bacterium]|nr:PorT family protein [Bacteroidales bacterium]
MSNKDWTDKLPGLLEGYTEAEPEGLWDAVQAGLAPKKRRIAAWWYAGGGILAAAAVIALFVLLRPVTPVPSVTVVPGDAMAMADDQIRRSEPANDEIPEPANDGGGIIPDRESPIAEVTVYEEASVDEQIGETEPVTEEVPAKDEMADHVGHDDEPVIPGSDRESPRTKKPLPINVQISLSATGYMGQMAQNSTTGVGLPDTPGIRPNAVPATKASGSGASSIPMMLGRNKASTTNATHSQSARVALGIRIGITDRWGVESGIVSSTLTSDFTSTAGSSSDNTTREIRYLGIPLYASYSLYQTGRLGIMLNAGPMYEFSTKTSTSKQSYIGDSRADRTTDNTLYEDSKWSANLGAALQLRTGKHGALYVQPGFSYHFPDNSALETFYTAHPAAFSLTFGYKFLY